jgi:hypothetical protein
VRKACDNCSGCGGYDRARCKGTAICPIPLKGDDKQPTGKEWEEYLDNQRAIATDISRLRRLQRRREEFFEAARRMLDKPKGK